MSLRRASHATRRATRISLPLVGAFVVGAIAYGGLYTFPALSVAFAADFGIPRTLAVTPWTMFLVVTAVASPLLGRAYDEWADRDLLTAAMVLIAGGWLALYLAPDISVVILAFAGLHAVGLQLAFLGTSTAIARRYAGMSGLALGITYAGPGIGVAVALPLAAGIIETSSWREAALLFLGAALVGVAFVWLMTSGPPIVVPARNRATESDQARIASGLHETAAPGAVSAGLEIPPAGWRDRPRGVRRTLRTRRFWALFVGAMAIGAFDEGVLQSFIPQAAGRGVGAELAASALGLQSLAYVAGQIVGGWLSDHLGRRVVGVAAVAVVAAGIGLIFGAPAGATALIVAGVVAHGLGTGATIAVRSAAIGDVFGGVGFGTVFGLLAVAYPVGGTVMVYAGAVALDRTGSFGPIVPLLMATLAIWATALWLAGPRRRRVELRPERGPAA
jgi:MFS family permease